MNRRDFSNVMLTTAVNAGLPVQVSASGEPQPRSGAITDIPGIRVGHFTDKSRPTGCTVLIFEKGAVAGIDIRGSASGTRGTDGLNPLHLTQQTHAIVLSGGSQFGLDTVTGVERYLEERGIGFHMAGNVIPLVAGAILFDLELGNSKVRPDAAAGYQACLDAKDGAVAEGNVGAGAGASVGKLFGMKFAMKSGLGTASVQVGNTGIWVGAIVAVNAVGDVYDPAAAKIVAGARDAQNKGFRNTIRQLRAGYGVELPAESSTNTTIGVVATNAILDKVQVTKIAQMAQDGMARAINPVHTLWDGDTLFAVATGAGKIKVSHSAIGAIAAEVLAAAIVRAVKQADSLPGLPSWRDFQPTA
jgi:L-aminopeptidase/D-esterase-like protein